MKMVGLDRNTVYEWYRKFRSIASEVILENSESVWGSGKMGGPGVMVWIDESKFGKRKNGRGRRAKGPWVLGILSSGEGEIGRIIIIPVPDRRADTLIPIIERHVARGSTIVTDEWRAYSSLCRRGYRHLKVNHSLEFVDGGTGLHTQNIEVEWRHLKAQLGKCGIRANLEYYADHLCEYAYRKCLRHKYADKDPFKVFLSHIGVVRVAENTGN